MYTDTECPTMNGQIFDNSDKLCSKLYETYLTFYVEFKTVYFRI